MTELVLIGAGMGSPAHLTGAGAQALRAAGLILLPRKGDDKSDLAQARLRIIKAVGATAPVAAFDMPRRDPALPYLERVARWHDEIARRWAAAIAGAGPSSGPTALLIWGDPSLYDSSLRIAARLDPAPKLRVEPGVTALQALTAAHSTPLNTLGGSVLITTGRRLRREGWPENADSVAVMLDGGCAFQTLDPAGLRIWWGAYLGMPEEMLDAGPLAQAGPRILRARAAARARHGWIMDVYLLRRAG